MGNTLNQHGDTLTFPNNGKGVFIYTKRISEGGVVEIYLTSKKVTGMCKTTPKDNFMRFRINSEGVKFDLCLAGQAEDVFTNVYPEKGSGGLEVDRTASYWISVDRDSFLIKYGKGYVMNETTFLSIDFNHKNKRAKEKVQDTFFSPAMPLYLMVFIQTEQVKNQPNPLPMIEAEPVFQFKTRPLAGNLPHLVKDSSAVTLSDLDRGQFIFSDDLPTASQELYNIIKNCELDYPADPHTKLSDAIRYSITTEDKFLYELIKKKMEGKNFKHPVYIRVTLGEDTVTAPGIPYVLEIWPIGSGTTIHDHGGACTAMKILFGEIDIEFYNKVTSPPPITDMKPLLNTKGKKGEIMWMDENWYQTHKLKNTSKDFCAIIQTYRYRSDDNIQWPGFDYIPAGNSHIQKIVYPGSDTTFHDMKTAVLEEYNMFLAGQE